MEERIKVICTRCPVGTATELALKKGWLQDGLQAVNSEFCLLQSLDTSYHNAHFTQQYPLHFRDGGNIPPMWAQSQEDRSVLLGVTYQNELRGVYVRNDSDIKTLEDLKGKRIALPIRPEAPIDFRWLTAKRGFELLLAAAGLTWNDVEICEIDCGAPPVEKLHGMDYYKKDSDFLTGDFQAVLDNKADAAFANSIKAVRHNEAGLLRNILPLERHKNITNINNNCALVITCTKPFAYEHPEIVVAYLKEVIKAARWSAENKEAFLEATASGVYDATPREFGLAFSDDIHLMRVPELTDKSFELLESQMQFMFENGKISRTFDLRQWADDTFLKQAFAELDAE